MTYEVVRHSPSTRPGESQTLPRFRYPDRARPPPRNSIPSRHRARWVRNCWQSRYPLPLPNRHSHEDLVCPSQSPCLLAPLQTCPADSLPAQEPESQGLPLPHSTRSVLRRRVSLSRAPQLEEVPPRWASAIPESSPRAPKDRCSAIGSCGAGATTSLCPMLRSPILRMELASTLGGGSTTEA